MRASLCLFLYFAAAGCSGALPEREQPAGNCTEESDCMGGQACVANQCVACSTHSDCASLVCDTYGDQGGVGTCVQASNILYVQSVPEGSTGSCPKATGAKLTPYCSLTELFTAVPAPAGKIIRLLPGGTAYTVPPIDASFGAIAIVGSGDFAAGKATSLTPIDGYWVVKSGANVLLDGVTFSGDSIVATSATVTIRRSSLNYLLNVGASFTDCKVTLDRDLLTTSDFGLNFTSSMINVTNCFIGGNFMSPSPNLIEINGGSGNFQFNTVAHNAVVTPSSLAMNCTNSANVLVKNSIFVHNNVVQQLSTSCRTTQGSLVLGTSSKSPTGQVIQDPVFEDPANLDFRLKPFEQNNIQFLFDKAVEVNQSDKNVDHDYFGTPRPQGGGYDIGAFELKAP